MRNVARMEKMRNSNKILVRKLEGRDHSEDIGIDGRVILE